MDEGRYLSAKALERMPQYERETMAEGEPNRKDEKAEIPRKESETVKSFDGTITVFDKNNGIPVEAMEHMPESQTAYHEHRLLTLNDLKQIQREYAGRRMARQNLSRENSVKRDGYSLVKDEGYGSFKVCEISKYNIDKHPDYTREYVNQQILSVNDIVQNEKSGQLYGLCIAMQEDGFRRIEEESVRSWMMKICNISVILGLPLMKQKGAKISNIH